VTCGSFVVYELLVFRADMVSELSIIARMVGDNCVAALTFEDPGSARQTLETLRAHPRVVGAAVYNAPGRLFASYSRDQAGAFVVPPEPRPAGYRFAGDGLHLWMPLTLAGEPGGTVFVQQDLEGIRAVLWRYALIAAVVMAAASLVAWLVGSWLRGAISGPITELAAIVGQVSAEEDYSLRASKRGEDELGRLIDGFNGMLEQIQQRDHALQEGRDHLERRVAERTEELSREIRERQHAEAELESIHKQLLDASRRSGMAEIATNVLHNVGNVLNSVNVSASVAAETVRKSRAGGLARAVALLREHQSDLATFISADPRGRHIPDYLGQLAEHLTADQAAILGELDSLRANIEHIKDIVAMQQSYAKVSGVKELVDVSELAEDSLRINFGALNRHGVVAVREYAKVPPVIIDKNKVLQILVNLVRNAKYACDESGRSDKRVALRIVEQGGRICISVSDNGIGIPAENMTRIFEHGFTTRPGGHGFGLHSGALAAREIGGALHAHSDGIGCGATFTLELPPAAEEEVA
jgi:signal transduction histidine kinase